MNMKRNTATSEIRVLSAVELDAVSGGEMMSFTFKVAGMTVSGYGTSDGKYHAQVGVRDGTSWTAYGGGGQL
jgi:hypothetical protein